MERRVGGGAARRAIRGGGDVSTAASLEILERAEHQKNYRAGRGTGTKGSALRNSGGGGWSVEEQLDEVRRGLSNPNRCVESALETSKSGPCIVFFS